MCSASSLHCKGLRGQAGGEHLSKKMPRVQVCQSYKFQQAVFFTFFFFKLLSTKPNHEDDCLSAVLFQGQYFLMELVMQVTINCIYNVGYDGMGLSITSLTWGQDFDYSILNFICYVVAQPIFIRFKIEFAEEVAKRKEVSWTTSESHLEIWRNMTSHSGIYGQTWEGGGTQKWLINVIKASIWRGCSVLSTSKAMTYCFSWDTCESGETLQGLDKCVCLLSALVLSLPSVLIRVSLL